MEKIEVGKKWPGGILPFDGPVFDYTASGPMLTLYMDRPTEKEIKATQSGKVRMGYYVRGCVIFIVFMLGSIWMDAPFSIRKHDGSGPEFDWSDSIGDDQGLLIQVSLVDRADSTVKSIRAISTSNAFAKGLRAEILKQLEQPFSDSMYDKIIDEVYGSLSSEDLAKRWEDFKTLYEAPMRF